MVEGFFVFVMFLVFLSFKGKETIFKQQPLMGIHKIESMVQSF